MSITADLRCLAYRHLLPTPLPFTRSELASHAFSLLGLEFTETKSVLSELHAMGMITNPASDVSFLPCSLQSDVVLIFPHLKQEMEQNDVSNELLELTWKMSPVWKSDDLLGEFHGIIPSPSFSRHKLSGTKVHRDLFNLITERFLRSMTIRPQVITLEMRETVLGAANLINQLETDASDENKGLWRFWNRKAAELAAKLDERASQ